MNDLNATHPKDDLSETLLASIPRKVHMWLRFLGVDITAQRSYENLSWDFDSNSGHLSVDETHIFFTQNVEKTMMEDDAEIRNAFEPFLVKSSETWVTSIPDNIEKFIELEKKIYDVVEKLDKEVRLRQTAQFEAAVEEKAKSIYVDFEGADKHPWVEGGNSFMQDKARRLARAHLQSEAEIEDE